MGEMFMLISTEGDRMRQLLVVVTVAALGVVEECTD